MHHLSTFSLVFLILKILYKKGHGGSSFNHIKHLSLN